MGRRSARGVFAAGLALVVGSFVACSTPESAGPPTVSPSSPAPLPLIASGIGTEMAKVVRPASGQTLAVLETLAVKGRAPLTGYSREAFGPDWADVNRNGCDTRNDILARDLDDTEIRNCVVLRGELRDPYSGDLVLFVRGPVSSMDVQIDHVVALANAWQTGADRWDDQTRQRFANDPRNLLAVRGDLNMSKGDGDAATWLPPRKSFRCAYVERQIDVKAAYGLWVTAPEKAAVQRVLARC